MNSLDARIGIVFVAMFLSSVANAQIATTTIAVPTTQSTDPGSMTFRQKTGIARMPIMKAAVKEAGFPDEKRDKLLAILDDSGQKMQDLLNEYDNSPNDSADELEEKRKKIANAFQTQTQQILNGADQMEVSRAMQSLSAEFRLIEKATLLDAMSKLELTGDQKTKLKSIVDQTADKLKNPSTTNPSAGVSESERRQGILIAAHDQVHDVLTDDQKLQWETELHHRVESHGGISEGQILRALPRPAP